MACPICKSVNIVHFNQVSGYDYLECSDCESLFIAPDIIDKIDGGHSIMNYESEYWRSELSAAQQRSYGPSLARMAEAILYARRPVERFLDIGSGGGFLLDSIGLYLPNASHRFFGIEKYPPASHTKNSNFFVGDIRDLPFNFDAGVCVEVIEHVTPKILTLILEQLSLKSNDNALYVFNSGQPHFVKHEDLGYLDPTGRGHIVSYSIRGMRFLAEPLGFRVHDIPGKSWAFALEKTSNRTPENIVDRIWSADPSNRDLLNDKDMGSVMFLLGLESARAYI